MTKEINLYSKLFINQSALLYGLTNSGKSTVIKHILYLLKDEIEQIVVIAGNSDCAMSYEGIVPSPLIYLSINHDMLKLLWERQDVLHATALKANKQEVLKSLYERLNIKDSKIEDLNNSLNKILSSTTNKVQEMNLKKKYNDLIIQIYKSYITDNYSTLMEMKLSDDEKFSLKYYNLNPKLLLIMDDVASDLKTINTLLEKMFFQGRHRSMSVIISVQDDKKVLSEIRKNSFISIFTSDICATATFNKQSNSYSKDMKMRAEMAIKDVFNSNDYYNLLYLRDRNLFFKFKSPQYIDDFEFGSETIREFCEKIKKKDGEISTNNPFSKLFIA